MTTALSIAVPIPTPASQQFLLREREPATLLDDVLRLASVGTPFLYAVTLFSYATQKVDGSLSAWE